MKAFNLNAAVILISSVLFTACGTHTATSVGGDAVTLRSDIEATSNKPSFTLVPPLPVVIVAGGAVELPIALDVTNFRKDVTVRLLGLPAGVSATTNTITVTAAGKYQGVFSVAVHADVTPGKYPVTLRAEQGRNVSETQAVLTVQPRGLSSLTGSVPGWSSSTGKVYATIYHPSTGLVNFDGTLDANGKFVFQLPSTADLERVLLSTTEILGLDRSQPNCKATTTFGNPESRLAGFSTLTVSNGTRDVGILDMRGTGDSPQSLPMRMYAFVYADSPTTYQGQISCEYADPYGGPSMYNVTEYDVAFNQGWGVLVMTVDRVGDVMKATVRNGTSPDGQWNYMPFYSGTTSQFTVQSQRQVTTGMSARFTSSLFR